MNQMTNLPEMMANKFSCRDQLIKLVEELGECTTAIARLLNQDHRLDIVHTKNFIDEVVDVEFLFAQMRFYFDGFIEAEERNNAEVKARFFNG